MTTTYDPIKIAELNAAKAAAVQTGGDPMAGNLSSYAAFTGGPTIGDVYGSNFKAPGMDTSTGAAIDAGINLYGGVANAPVDENAIRAQTIGQFQKEIDAGGGTYSPNPSAALTSGSVTQAQPAAFGGNAAMNIMTPFLAMNFIIKT